MPSKLSICIATYNRGQFIAETLDSILNQVEPGVEVVVVDGASTDDTPEVMARYVSRYPHIRYFREPTNSGIDEDYDKVVGYAEGEYCWLMPDDDLIRPGSVRRVLSAISDNVDLVVVDAEVRNADMSLKLEDSRLKFDEDRVYETGEHETFFMDVANHLNFIGCVIIRRDFWLSRDRSTYYGTVFIHVGVIFQHPPPKLVRVISDPLVIIRYGNAMWTPRAFNIWMFKWPQLVWSFSDYSDETKQSVCHYEPWRKIKQVFHFRAKGAYSLAEFNKYFSDEKNTQLKLILFSIAAFPEKLANILAVVYLLFKDRSNRLGLYDLLLSRKTPGLSRYICQLFGK